MSAQAELSQVPDQGLHNLPSWFNAVVDHYGLRNPSHPVVAILDSDKKEWQVENGVRPYFELYGENPSGTVRRFGQAVYRFFRMHSMDHAVAAPGFMIASYPEINEHTVAQVAWQYPQEMVNRIQSLPEEQQNWWYAHIQPELTPIELSFALIHPWIYVARLTPGGVRILTASIRSPWAEIRPDESAVNSVADAYVRESDNYLRACYNHTPGESYVNNIRESIEAVIKPLARSYSAF